MDSVLRGIRDRLSKASRKHLNSAQLGMFAYFIPEIEDFSLLRNEGGLKVLTDDLFQSGQRQHVVAISFLSDYQAIETSFGQHVSAPMLTFFNGNSRFPDVHALLESNTITADLTVMSNYVEPKPQSKLPCYKQPFPAADRPSGSQTFPLLHLGSNQGACCGAVTQGEHELQISCTKDRYHHVTVHHPPCPPSRPKIRFAGSLQLNRQIIIREVAQAIGVEESRRRVNGALTILSVCLKSYYIPMQ